MVHGLNGHERTPHLTKRCIVLYYNDATGSTDTKEKIRKGYKLSRPNTLHEQEHNENRDRVV